MTSQSNFIKNGQIANVPAGYAAIAANSLMEIGGPGNEAWPIATTDYAVAGLGTIAAEAKFASSGYQQASGTYSAVARDRLGNIYTAFPGVAASVLYVTKTSPTGDVIASATMVAASVVSSPAIVQLQNGNFVLAWNDSSTKFLIFDSALNILAGAITVGTAYAVVAGVTALGLCALSGGGFAVAYQSSAGTAINFATYDNSGTQVVAPTNIQTLTVVSAEFMALAQISNGNIVCAFNGSAQSGGVTGSSHVVVTTAGAAVAGPTHLQSSSAYRPIQIAVMTGFYAVAANSDSNTLKCGVYSNAGAVQGTPLSVAASGSVSPTFRVMTDGIQFWLAYIAASPAGLACSKISTAGVIGATTTGMGGSTVVPANYNMDAAVVNDVIVCLFVPASGNSLSPSVAGRATIGLADASLGIVGPYLRGGVTAVGSASYSGGGNATLRCLSGGGGLYTGASPTPIGQPTTSSVVGDYTVIFVYDNTSAAGTYAGIVKVEATAIVGIGQPILAQGFVGTSYAVNVGPGSYSANPVAGTNGLYFNYAYSTPSGGIGTIYSDGISLGRDPNLISGIQPGTTTLPGNGAFKSSIVLFDTVPGTKVWTVPAGVTRIRPFTVGGGGTGVSGGGGGGYSETYLTVKPGQQFSYTVGAAAGTSSFGGIITSTGGGSGSGGSGSGGAINTSGGNTNGASGHRFGDGFSGVSGGGGWSSGNASASAYVGGGNCVDGWGIGLFPGLPAAASQLATAVGIGIAQSPAGYGCGGGGADGNTPGGPGGPGGGGGSGSGGSAGGPGGLGGGGGASGSPGAGGNGVVGVEVLG